MHLFRTRFKKDIVCEFLPPSRTTKKKRVIIVAPGMPGLPGNKDFAYEYAKKGYWVFMPRYRGTWESGGEFLRYTPTKDITDIIDELFSGKEFKEFWGGIGFVCVPDELIVLGISFGGVAALTNSKDPRVDKVITLAGVIDIAAPSKTEPREFLDTFTRHAFGNGYRYTRAGFTRLFSKGFYNALHTLDGYVGSKILLIHCEDDDTVRFKEVKEFAQKTGASLVSFKKGGHGKGTKPLLPRTKRHIDAFLKS
jgi:pimeloyl-ACP methyl ester carboxylesterase